MGYEQQLGLFGFHHLGEPGIGITFVQATFERRIGQDDIEKVFLLLGVISQNVLIQSVLVADIRAVHSVQHHVHAGDPQHGGVEVKAPKHVFVDVLAVRFK
ncbi:hypothetical protein D3C77_647960 [compost metagenome]